MSFKPVSSDAAKHLNTLYPTQKGTPKSQSSCKTKWNALKKQYSVVKNIKSLSVFSWNDEHSVSVTPETSGAWDAHTKAHLQSKPFSFKGFLKFVMHQPHARKQPEVSVCFIFYIFSMAPPPPVHIGASSTSSIPPLLPPQALPTQ
ncbi:hypothetical protein BDR07DRAFT_1484641 [Suillus spraguei]|nr:hypothetical protein BDR07DRAFT_1484641 [Suillus spraguei]